MDLSEFTLRFTFAVRCVLTFNPCHLPPHSLLALFSVYYSPAPNFYTDLAVGIGAFIYNSVQASIKLLIEILSINCDSDCVNCINTPCWRSSRLFPTRDVDSVRLFYTLTVHVIRNTCTHARPWSYLISRSSGMEHDANKWLNKCGHGWRLSVNYSHQTWEWRTCELWWLNDWITAWMCSCIGVPDKVESECICLL